MDDSLFIAIIVMLGVTAMGGGALINRENTDYESSGYASGVLFVAIILLLVSLVFGAGALYVMHSQ